VHGAAFSYGFGMSPSQPIWRSMLTLTKRTLAAAAMIAAASAPATASARYNLNPEPSAVTHPVQTLPPARPARPAPEANSASGGFEWGDAGLGAAGTLVLLATGAGSAAMITRRRGHQAQTS
jgi:hypothetical protein